MNIVSECLNESCKHDTPLPPINIEPSISHVSDSKKYIIFSDDNVPHMGPNYSYFLHKSLVFLGCTFDTIKYSVFKLEQSIYKSRHSIKTS